MNKFNFKSEKILNKKFTAELSGYSPREVDQYLDMILEDYRVYEATVEIDKEKLSKRGKIIQDRDDEIQKLLLEIQNLKNQLSKKNGKPTSNVISKKTKK